MLIVKLAHMNTSFMHLEHLNEEIIKSYHTVYLFKASKCSEPWYLKPNHVLSSLDQGLHCEL